MRVVAQRVADARVEIDGKTVARIGRGLLLFVGFEESDAESDLTRVSSKLVKLRIFSDENGAMNRSVADMEGEILVVSQFTLFASIKKGNRPSFSRAACPDRARPLFLRFVRQLESDLERPVQSGVFGADMAVFLTNDGPVTIQFDSRALE